MIGGNEESVTALFALLVNLADSLVCLAASNNSRIVYTSVANHVWRSKVVHEELELSFLYPLTQLLCDSHCTHLWLLVVCRDLWTLDELALLVLELNLLTTVEKESDMGVLFGLSNVALTDSLL